MFKKPLYILLLCQFLIIATALGGYLFNRGDAFSKVYTREELTLAAGELTEDGGMTKTEKHGHDEEFISFTEALDKGIYIVRVNYHTTSDENILRASTSLLSDLDFRTAPTFLDPALRTAYITLELNRSCDDVLVEIAYSGEGNLTIQEISLHETSNYYKKNIFYAFCLCILLTLVYVFYKADKEKRSTMMGLSAIFLLSCYPLFTDYMQVGHDLPFHLLRIDGIYHGLLQGTFPVKIAPVWAKDYGYAVGVFYGDAALYLPAFLRIFGFSVQTAYKYFVAFMNFTTVFIAYYSFRKMFDSQKAGMLGCALYTFSLYRLSDLYTRAAVGEYTALTFLPLVLCGFYLIFTEPKPSENRFKNAAIVALGLTGVIQSHVLSCEMIVIFVAITCLLLIKKVIQPQTLLTLALGAGLTLLMNIGFLLPFLDFFDDAIYINSPEWGQQTAYSIQNKGMFPVQLLGLFNHTDGGSWSTLAGVTEEAAYSLGLPITLCVTLFLYITLCRRNVGDKDALFKPALLCCGLGLLALYMSSCYFPWDALAATGAVAETLISTLQFPWRFLAIATILLLFPSCYAIMNAGKYFSTQGATVITASFLSLLIVSTGWYFYEFAYMNGPYRVYDTYELNSMAMYSCEYLPTGTDPDKIIAGRVNTSDGTTISDYQKNGTTITCNVTTGAGGGTIEFPLNYYKYYQCESLSDAALLPTEPGTNCMVKVSLPKDYSGTIRVSFHEPLLWRVCEVLSLLTIIAGFIILLPKHFLKKPS